VRSIRGGTILTVVLLVIAVRVILRLSRHGVRAGGTALVVGLLVIGALVAVAIVQNRRRNR
jgi:hypothetical protein